MLKLQKRKWKDTGTLLESHLVVNNHPVNSIPYENVSDSETETEGTQELDPLDSNLLNT